MGPHGIFLSSWFHHDHIKEAKAHSHLIAPRHAINNKYNKNRCPLSPRSTIIRRRCFVIVQMDMRIPSVDRHRGE